MTNERRCVGQIGHLNVLHGGRGGRGGERDEIHSVSLAINESWDMSCSQNCAFVRMEVGSKR
jgi:hypothetical protein